MTSTLRQNSTIWLSLLLSIFLAQGFWTAHQIMVDRQAKQDRAVATWQRWQQQVTRLIPVDEEFRKTFTTFSQLSDQYGVIQHLNLSQYGLVLPEAGFSVGQPQEVKQNNVPLGLYRYPVTNGNAALMVTAPDFARLYAAIPELLKRPDIRFDGIKISAPAPLGTPTMSLINFSLLLRD